MALAKILELQVLKLECVWCVQKRGGALKSFVDQILEMSDDPCMNELFDRETNLEKKTTVCPARDAT